MNDLRISESEEDDRYRLLFESMLNGFAYCRMHFLDGEAVDFTYLKVNSAFESLTGLTQVTGRRVTEVIPGIRQQDPRLFEIYGRVVRSGLPERFEMHVKSLNTWFAVAAYCPHPEHFVAIFEVIDERKRAEAALLLDGEMMRSMADGVQLARATDGRIIQVNPQFERMFGYQPGELVGRHVSILNSSAEDSPENVAQKIIQSLESTGKWEGEIENVKKDGTPFWCFARVSYFDHFALGRLWVSVHQDITERKQMEQRLRLLSVAVEQSQVSIVITDPQGAIEYVNPKFSQLTGYSLEEVRGQNPRVLKGDATSTEQYRQLWQTISRGLQWTGEFHNRKKSGEFYWESATISPIVNEAGRLTHFVAVKEDITQRKQMESALLRSVSRLESILNAIPDPIWLKDLNGVYESVNKAWLEFFGLSAGSIIGKTGHDFLPQEVADRLDFEDLGVLATRVPLRQVEKMNDHAGRLNWFETVKIPLVENSGHVAGTVGMARNITERRELELQLRQAQKMEAIGQLAGGVAHDFNNVLAAIMMQLAFLELSEGLDLETRESLKEMELAVKRAAGLTRQLLMFSRRSVLDAKIVDLNEVVENLLSMLRRLIGENIVTVFERGSGSQQAMVDTGLIEQVLMNLCVNARDAMPNGGLLNISTRRLHQADPRNPQCSRDFICLTVQDTGCGMSEEVLKRVFEPFFTTKEVGKGTGLGLATVHGIVAQHQGWVEVDSKINQGTSFRVMLPAIEHGHSTDSNENPDTASAMQLYRGNETILLVEDEAEVRRNVSKLLKALGYKVIEAANGLEAMTHWEQHSGQIALLFSDMVMPEGLTGMDLAIRFQGEKPSLKVIISSGYSSELTSNRHPARVKVGYLPKPYGLESLGRTIRNLLDSQSPVDDSTAPS